MCTIADTKKKRDQKEKDKKRSLVGPVEIDDSHLLRYPPPPALPFYYDNSASVGAHDVLLVHN